MPTHGRSAYLRGVTVVVVHVTMGEACTPIPMAGMFVRVIVGVFEVRVIDVQAPGLFMVTARPMHVGQAGHGAERQVQGTKPQYQDPAHHAPNLMRARIERQPRGFLAASALQDLRLWWIAPPYDPRRFRMAAIGR